MMLAFEDGNTVLRRQGVPRLYAKLGLPTSPQTIPVRVITSALPMVGAYKPNEPFGMYAPNGSFG